MSTEHKPKLTRPTKKQWFWALFGLLGLGFCFLVVWPEYWFALLILFKSVIKKLVFGVWHKLLTFFLSLSAAKAMNLAVKRFVIDHIVTKNMRHFIRPVMVPIRRIWRHWKKKTLLWLPAPLITSLVAFWLGIDKVLAILLQKSLIIAFFKWLWTLPFLLWRFINGRFIRPVLELIAVNWLFNRVLKKFPRLIAFFQPVTAALFRFFGVIDERIQKPTQKILDKSGQKVGERLHHLANRIESQQAAEAKTKTKTKTKASANVKVKTETTQIMDEETRKL